MPSRARSRTDDREAGDLRCPDEVSLISFDALDITELTDPALTGIFQPGYQLGYTAGKLLLDRVNGLDAPGRDIVLKTELKVRDSVSRLLVG
jgi:DNA-binding LacI/PurR family transcriptional regulator